MKLGLLTNENGMNKNFIISAVLILFLMACSSNSLSGEYHAEGFSVINTFKFKGGGKVEISNMMQTSMGTYKRDGDRIVVTANGDAIVFKVLDGGKCIDGGGMLGKFCKK